MLGRGAPLICIIRRRLIPLQLIITSNRCTSFPHCQAQRSGFPALGRQRSSELRWLGAEKRSAYNLRLLSACGDLPGSFSWVMLTHNAKSWELGWKGTGTLRLLIRNVFGAIRVLTNLHFKMLLLWEEGTANFWLNGELLWVIWLSPIFFFFLIAHDAKIWLLSFNIHTPQLWNRPTIWINNQIMFIFIYDVRLRWLSWRQKHRW